MVENTMKKLGSTQERENTRIYFLELIRPPSWSYSPGQDVWCRSEQQAWAREMLGSDPAGGRYLAERVLMSWQELFEPLKYEACQLQSRLESTGSNTSRCLFSFPYITPPPILSFPHQWGKIIWEIKANKLCALKKKKKRTDNGFKVFSILPSK